MQFTSQVIPGGVSVTVPAPVPARSTASGKVCTVAVNVALTSLAAVIVTVHVVAVAGVQPVHPPNVEPAPAVAVSVTTVPLGWGSVQSAPQLMPAGVEVTVPVPVPAGSGSTVSVKVCPGAANVAVTVRATVIATVHVGFVPAVAHAWPQPSKVVLPVGVAVSVTVVPLA